MLMFIEIAICHNILVENGAIPNLISILSSSAWQLQIKASACLRIIAQDQGLFFPSASNPFPLLPLSLPSASNPYCIPFPSPFHSSFSLLPFPFILPPSPFSSPFSIRFYVPYPLLPTYISPPISFLLSMHVWMTPYKHSFIFVSLFGKHEKRTNSMYMYIYVCVCWYVWGVGK